MNQILSNKKMKKTSVPITLKMLIISKAKYWFLGMTDSRTSPNQSLKPDASHPSAIAKLPPTRNMIVQGKCRSMSCFHFNRGSYLLPLKMLCFGQAHIRKRIKMAEEVSLTYLYLYLHKKSKTTIKYNLKPLVLK